VPLLHDADANDADMGVNQRFFGALEYMTTRGTPISPEDVLRIFVDFVIEARKLERLGARGDPCEMRDVTFSIKLLLVQISLLGSRTRSRAMEF
jgi:hypothetical protein